jgi:hypothetical protein
MKIGLSNLRITMVLITLLFVQRSFSQTLFPEGQKLKQAYEKLVIDSFNPKLQINYVEAFPSDTGIFLKIFASPKFDQLYDGFQYIFLFEQCGRLFPKEVIGKCIDIGKNLRWDADAVGYLQRISINLATRNIPEFVAKYNSLSEKKRDDLLNFYADMEDPTFKGFQDLIDELKSVGETSITFKLEKARTDRMQRQHH